jgi:hypothetical protein
MLCVVTIPHNIFFSDFKRMSAKFKGPASLKIEERKHLAQSFPEEDLVKQILLQQLNTIFVSRKDVKVNTKEIRRDKELSRSERKRRIIELKAAEAARLAAERQLRTDLQKFITLGTNSAIKNIQKGRTR